MCCGASGGIAWHAGCCAKKSPRRVPAAREAVIAGHHQPVNTAAFELADVVRVAVLAADALGFDVLPPVPPRTLASVRAMLPEAAQYRFDPDPDALVAKLTDRLNTFD